jgi:hypothetical protein
MTALTDAEYAYLRSELGDTDRADLDQRYERLGSVHAVALETLREGRAALVADPLAVSVQGSQRSIRLKTYPRDRTANRHHLSSSGDDQRCECACFPSLALSRGGLSKS